MLVLDDACLHEIQPDLRPSRGPRSVALPVICPEEAFATLVWSEGA